MKFKYNNIQFIKTDAEHPEFLKLVKILDVYLQTTDREEHSFYSQYNKLDNINHVILVKIDNQVVACGALKKYSKDIAEVKRMFTLRDWRRVGLSSKLLHQLENWASTIGFSYCILETGKRQFEAIKFYQKNLYEIIPNYGQYSKMQNSICFKKKL